MRPLTAWSAGILLAVLGACGGIEESEEPQSTPQNTIVREAKAEGVTAVAQIYPLQVDFGGEVVVELEIRTASGVTLPTYDFGKYAGHFRVRKRRRIADEERDGLTIVRYRAIFETTRSGPHIGRLAPVTYSVAQEEDQEATTPRQLTLPTFEVVVAEPAVEAITSLDDLGGPADPLLLPANRRITTTFWITLAALATAAFAGWLLWRRLRRRRPEHAPRIDPRELAYGELEALLASDLIEQGLYAEFYYELTRIVREFIERTTGLRAPEQTTEEFLRDAELHETFELELRRRLRHFLETADLIKYAAQVPRQQTVEQSFDAAKSFVGLEPTAREEAA